MFNVDINALIHQANQVIRNERSRYDPILATVISHTHENKLQISAPGWEATGIPPSSGFVVWCENALVHATKLANEIYKKHTRVITVKTLIPYEEFEIWIFGRALFTVCKYQMIKKISMASLFPHAETKMKGFGPITFLDPEIEIINQYRRLYMPFPEHWQTAADLEANMFAVIKKRITGGAHENKTYSTVRTLRNHIYELMKSNDFGILVGHWAACHISGEDASHEKIQIVLNHDISPEQFVKKLGALLRDVSKTRFQHHTDDISVPGDYWLQRTTYYVGDSVERIALMDTFNCQTYEMVPYHIQDGIKIGGAYLICRLFMIDKWILRVLHELKIIKSSRAEHILTRLEYIRGIDRLKFGDQYAGIYKDPIILKRKLIRTQDQKFYPYVPMHHERQFGKLREI